MEVQQAHPADGPAAVVGVANLPGAVVAVLTRKERFQELANSDEHSRLHKALKDRFH